MKISGSGKLSEMSIEDTIVVSGSVKMDGNIECQGFRSSGSTRGEGNLTVHGDVKSTGSFRLTGMLNTDGNAKLSGSTTVGEEIFVKGELSNSGSLRVGNKVEVLQGVRLSGSTKIAGSLSSQETIEIEGSTTIQGDINGNNVFIEVQNHLVIRKVDKPLCIVNGSIFGTNNVDITHTLVDGDVKGRNVKIGKRTKVLGKVYCIDNIEVHVKATLAHEPIQITEIAKD